MERNDRVDHVDIAKGMSIVLVVLYHGSLRGYAPEVIDSLGLFRMPLFFFLSGIFFSISSDFNSFALKKADALLKPYFFTSIVLLFISACFHWGPYKDHLIFQLRGILYGNSATIVWAPMWFLTHLFVVYCFSYLVFRFLEIQKKHLVYKFGLIILMLVIGTHWINRFLAEEIILFGKKIVLHGLPFSLDLIFISAAFFISGWLLKERIVKFIPNAYIFCLSILAFLVITVLTDAKIDLNNRLYVNPILATMGAASGIYFVLAFSVYIRKIKIIQKPFQELGRASLFILIFHFHIGNLVYMTLAGFGLTGTAKIIISLVAFSLSLYIPLLIQSIVLRNELLSMFYFPFQSSNTLYQKCRTCFTHVHLLKEYKRIHK